MDENALADYLAAGGKLTNPANAPVRYRGELMRTMSVFVDSELAGAAGFADIINAAPGIKERIAAAKIVLEKTDHADRVLRLMGEFGANTDRYATHQPWHERLPREAEPGARRNGHDMRLSVLDYPLRGWADAVTMNLVVGHAVILQLEDMALGTYQPLADTIRELLPRERRHVELAAEGLERLVGEGQGDAIGAGLAYWRPRTEAVFGATSESRSAKLRSWGLRHIEAREMRQLWRQRLARALDGLGIRPTPSDSPDNGSGGKASANRSPRRPDG